MWWIVCGSIALQMFWIAFSFMEFRSQGLAIKKLRDETTGPGSLARQAMSSAATTERAINEGVALAFHDFKGRIETLEKDTHPPLDLRASILEILKEEAMDLPEKTLPQNPAG